jgi:DNA (cytosine-5)-methyltransferase 1
VLDAQNFGVAQRRRRVFVVGHLGNWKPAAEVLFESESLSGDIKKGRSEKQNTTKGFIPSVANTLQTTCNDYSRADGFNMIAFENSRRDTLRFFDNVSNTLQAAAGSGGGNVPCVAIQGNLIGRDKGGPQGIGVSEGETMYTLTKADVHGVATFVDTYNGTIQGDVSATMTADMAGPTHSGPKVMQNMAVRRLTPVECERLQGFPDNYTNIPKAADGNRYKALGNSMAVPVMRWIGERINQYEQRGMEKHL